LVGDDPEADIQGAEAVGIPEILARADTDQPVERQARDLWGVVNFISPDA
jgi:ribonucleotide monophosphatase NagD (HAD superfamily)